MHGDTRIRAVWRVLPDHAAATTLLAAASQRFRPRAMTNRAIFVLSRDVRVLMIGAPAEIRKSQLRARIHLLVLANEVFNLRPGLRIKRFISTPHIREFRISIP